MTRALARLMGWVLGVPRPRPPSAVIVISAPPPTPGPIIHADRADEAARMALLKTRYARHTPIPGRDRPLRLDELTRLMRHVRAEHQEETSV